MTAEKYTFPVTDGGFDAVFREYRAIFEKQLRTVCDSFCDNGANTGLFMMRLHTALRQAVNA